MNYYRRKLVESRNLHDLVKKGDDFGCFIISAYKDNGFLEDFLNKEEVSELEKRQFNNRQTRKLVRILKDLGLSFQPVTGGYKEEGETEVADEKSFVVFNKYEGDVVYPESEFREIGVQLGKDFYQDSILYKKHGESPKYLSTSTKDENKEFFGKETSSFDSIDYDNKDREYFTSLRKGNDKTGRIDRRFSFYNKDDE